MRAGGSADAYISFKDHSAVVAECRRYGSATWTSLLCFKSKLMMFTSRLLDDLKGKYEESRAEMAAELSDLRIRFQRVRHERDSYKLQHK